MSEPIHSSTVEKNENQTPVQDQRCQSGPSAKNCRFLIFILTNSPHQSRLRYVLVHNFQRKLCIGSKKWRWLIGIRMPDFEVLDARIASALNRIIHNSHFKRRITLEEQKAQKQDRFLRGRQIAYLIYGYFRVTGAIDSVENYADLFTIVFRNDDIQEFDSKWAHLMTSWKDCTN